MEPIRNRGQAAFCLASPSRIAVETGQGLLPKTSRPFSLQLSSIPRLQFDCSVKYPDRVRIIDAERYARFRSLACCVGIDVIHRLIGVAREHVHECVAGKDTENAVVNPDCCRVLAPVNGSQAGAITSDDTYSLPADTRLRRAGTVKVREQDEHKHDDNEHKGS